MSDIAIRTENLSKLYKIGEYQGNYKTLREAIINTLSIPFRQLRRNAQSSTLNPQSDTIWALKDVSFQVKRGEVVGIIGRNGAGKTTLLKILSRITEPTEGWAEIEGRVGSLLEVGTGFHPELTGRENIYLNGAILGMKKAELNRKFDEIVAFAEIEKFIDTPVKRYSSGMYVRLAFAVAAHLEPEILLVDEVLAVGDAAFQKKCLGKMGDVAHEGRTVLFVSHNMAAVQSLCGRVIWLNDGKITEEGQPGRVVSSYLATSSLSLTEQVWEDPATAPGNDKVRVRRVCVRPKGGVPSDLITIRTPILMEFEYWNLVPNLQLSPGLSLFNAEGVEVFATGPVHEPVWYGRPFPVGLFRSLCYIPGDILNDGTYRVRFRAVQDQTMVIFYYNDILSFEVRDAVEMRTSWYGKWPGAVRPNLEWTTELVEPDEFPTLGAGQV
ncbi:MAG: polysaccharide ABC transporter ATP-binding protein [Candidatus Hodarchaeota archaeon]